MLVSLSALSAQRSPLHDASAISSHQPPCVAVCRLDRINQVDLPLDGAYSSGDYDGRGVHGEDQPEHSSFCSASRWLLTMQHPLAPDVSCHCVSVCAPAVYVLDTGVRATHSDFKGRVGAGASAVGSSVADDQGHGTHVSGIVLGTVHGVAPSAILHPVKVRLWPAALTSMSHAACLLCQLSDLRLTTCVCLCVVLCCLCAGHGLAGQW